MEIIKRGAEAVLYVGEFEGQKALVKERVKKGYRIQEIDLKLRKLRTRGEAKLLLEARKCGVPTPRIFDVDEKGFKIFMEFVDGTRMKEFLNTAKLDDATHVCRDIGKYVGKLHSNNIIHGDLTTSNMILKDGRIFFIDFGLGEFSKRIEDKAVDMSLLYEALRSTHYKILEDCWGEVIEGYKKEYKDAGAVMSQMKEIEKRGRYAKRNDQ